jgi:hypothetical protein
MTELTETNSWAPGIYQLELTDPVVGGADGLSNRQAKQLANRTTWLKAQVEAALASAGAKQPLDATLTALAALAMVADRLIYSTGSDAFAVTAFTAKARALLALADETAMRAFLQLGNAAQGTITVTNRDTTPGRLLKVGDYGIGSQNAGISGADLNNLAQTGFYMGSSLVSAPDGTAQWFYVVHQEHGALGYSIQHATTLGINPICYVRSKNAGNWGAWRTEWDSGNFDPTTKANLASPAMIGTPTAPTAAPGTSTTQLANTAFVQAAVSALVSASPAALDTLNELAAALGNDANFATTMTNTLAGKQPLDATLTALAAIATSANKLIYATGADTFATTTLSAFIRTLLDDADAPAALATLGAASQAGIDALGSFSAWQSTSQSIAANVPTAMRFHTEFHDSLNAYNPTNGRFTAPADGTYEFFCSVHGNGVGATGDSSLIDLHINGNGVRRMQEQNGSVKAIAGSSGPILMTAGDYAQIFFSSTGALTTNAFFTLTWFSGRRLA